MKRSAKTTSTGLDQGGRLQLDPNRVDLSTRILERYMTVNEAADFLRVSPAMVRHYLTVKKLRRYKVGSRTILLASDVQGLISISA